MITTDRLGLIILQSTGGVKINKLVHSGHVSIICDRTQPDLAITNRNKKRCSRRLRYMQNAAAIHYLYVCHSG